MKIDRLREILLRVQRARILVVGDFFLDLYWSVDPQLEERSIETGRRAHQIVEVRTSPGAAGTICNNLVALETSVIEVVGCIGDDGNGFELLRRMRAQGISVDQLGVSPDLRTPTYTKPMRRVSHRREEEMERFDVKNREAIPDSIERDIIRRLEHATSSVDGVVVLDQVEEKGCGVISGGVREKLAALALQYPEKTFVGDSRRRAGLYENLVVKTNRDEAKLALGKSGSADTLCRDFAERNRQTVFLTAGSKGIFVCDGSETRHFPAHSLAGPIDIVGAGDSVSAAVTASLCSGASCWEAAEIGNLAAAVTVQKVGTTGTASPEEILALAAQS